MSTSDARPATATCGGGPGPRRYGHSAEHAPQRRHSATTSPPHTPPRNTANTNTTGVSTMDRIILGAGALNWHPDERRIDRYGAVHLDRNPDDTTPSPVLFDAAPVGTHGRLVAVIVGTRPTFHLGDLARGVGSD